MEAAGKGRGCKMGFVSVAFNMSTGTVGTGGGGVARVGLGGGERYGLADDRGRLCSRRRFGVMGGEGVGNERMEFAGDALIADRVRLLPSSSETSPGPGCTLSLMWSKDRANSRRLFWRGTSKPGGRRGDCVDEVRTRART